MRPIRIGTEPGPLSLTPREIARLTRDVEVVVTLGPSSGTSPSGDWWVASIEALEIEALRLGLNNALKHLEDLAALAATEIISGNSQRGEAEDAELLPLALRTRADQQLGRLEQTLRSNDTVGDEFCLGHGYAPE